MKKLISLELKRCSLRPYHIAAAVSAITMLGFLYLMAAIPRLDPLDTDTEMFLSYSGPVVLSQIVSMAIFTILSAVMAAKFIVEEYSGKRAILLLSYPVKRSRILGAKLLMVFLYTFTAMLMSGALSLVIFFFTESLFPLCPETLTPRIILHSFLFLVFCALMAGLLGILSLWLGFLKKSVSVTIVSAVITVSVVCQILSAAVSLPILPYSFLAAAAIAGFLAIMSLNRKVKEMEV